MELKIEHIAPYIPYGLKVMYSGYGEDIVSDLSALHYEQEYDADIIISERGKDSDVFYWIKPILIPLSKLSDEQYAELGGIIMDLERHVSHKIRDGEDWLKGSMKPVMSPSTALKAIAYLHSIKADIHGLCAAGIAIDASTLETNPYQ